MSISLLFRYCQNISILIKTQLKCDERKRTSVILTMSSVSESLNNEQKNMVCAFKDTMKWFNSVFCLVFQKGYTLLYFILIFFIY